MLYLKQFNWSLILYLLGHILVFEGVFMLIAFGLLLVVCGVLLKRAELRVWGLLTLVALVFAILFTQ